RAGKRGANGFLFHVFFPRFFWLVCGLCSPPGKSGGATEIKQRPAYSIRRTGCKHCRNGRQRGRFSPRTAGRPGGDRGQPRAWGQRVWKRQPLGGLTGLGRSPETPVFSRLRATLGSATGMQDKRPLV